MIAVQEFLAQGDRVAALARNPPSDETSHESYTFSRADVTSATDLKNACDQVIARWGHGCVCA